MTENKVTTLQDIYKPLFENLVVEFSIPEKSKNGLILNDKQLKDLYNEQSTTLKVIAIADNVTNVKVGQYILPNPRCNLIQIPLIYRAATGVQHGQLHISEVLGIVDTDFAQIKNTETKETVIN